MYSGCPKHIPRKASNTEGSKRNITPASILKCGILMRTLYSSYLVQHHKNKLFGTNKQKSNDHFVEQNKPGIDKMKNNSKETLLNMKRSTKWPSVLSESSECTLVDCSSKNGYDDEKDLISD
ncbi:hypothetical protein CDAR_49061 [Caerostris darwini]|uniref:Uncharacterized protein n=1 Tax=Caerostris darwini TaxID=1538125 RepID=A0AAV4NJ55_9ARAC|nr:hypothetical protein CDAR_49061 [Caerostris darwini]